jgi:hypothetical protein
VVLIVEKLYIPGFKLIQVSFERIETQTGERIRGAAKLDTRLLLVVSV